MLKDIRYKDTKALVQYDLNTEIFNNYNFTIEDVIPVRKVFILITDKGNKILKKINFSIEELEFIYSGIDYIRKHSFDRVFNFQLTKEGKPYVTSGKNVYFIMDLIEARESEYSNPVDISIASQGLGELHKACEGFKYNKIRYACGNAINSFKRKLHEMELFKNIASIGEDKKEFDEIFLQNVDYYKKEMEESINILEKSSYYKLCSEEDKIVLCHHDLAHHNILVKDEKAYFVDFDYSVIDLRVHDLCNFINKVEKFSAYDIDNAKSILQNYFINNRLDKRELEVLYGMLMFPQDFYTIVKEYYTRTKDWEYETFLDKLTRKNDLKEDRREFIERFSCEIL